MLIDKRKIKVNPFSAECDVPLDRELRTYITIEADIYDVGYPTNNDGTFNEVYKAKLVGATIIKQGEKKDLIICKSKRSPSERLRASIWRLNDDEEYYYVLMDKIIANIESVAEYLKDK